MRILRQAGGSPPPHPHQRGSSAPPCPPLGVVLVLALLSACSRSSASKAQPPVVPRTLAVPPAGSLYHGVFPGGHTGDEDDVTPADVDEYERAAGRRVAWVYFSNNWFKSRAFPVATATWIRERGSVPFV